MGADQTVVKYKKTSVLILGWEADTDDTRTGEEVSYLRRITRSTFVTHMLIVLARASAKCIARHLRIPRAVSAHAFEVAPTSASNKARVKLRL